MRFHPSFPCAQSTGRSSPYIKSELSHHVHVRNWLGWMCRNINEPTAESVYGKQVLDGELRRSIRRIQSLSPDTGISGLKEWDGTFFKFHIRDNGDEQKIFLLPLTEYRTRRRAGHSESAKTATDNWTASFLILHELYVRHTGEVAQARECANQIDRAALHLQLLLDGHPDGQLSYASPDSPTRYTTDNLYTRDGLAAYARLKRKLGDVNRAHEFEALASDVARGIEGRLFHREGGHFLAWLNQRGFRWNRFYGDAVANIQAAALGDERLASLSRSLWPRFLAEQGAWARFTTRTFKNGQPKLERRLDLGVWSMVAYSATKSGDPASALVFISNLSRQYGPILVGGGKELRNLHVGELGWLLRTIILLRGSQIVDESTILSPNFANNARRHSVPDQSVADAEAFGVVLGPEYSEIEGSSEKTAFSLTVERTGDFEVHLLDVPRAGLTRSLSYKLSCGEAQTGSFSQEERKELGSRRLGTCRLTTGDIVSVEIGATDSKPMSFDGLLLIPKW